MLNKTGRERERLLIWNCLRVEWANMIKKGYYLESAIMLGQGEHALYVGQLFIGRYSWYVVSLIGQVVYSLEGYIHV